ncbi:hypothetical protein PR048_010035 [Dryococelus australis]|uniref:Uncharacterized protein n=1 Tax=Dryococelus australis TaxID=614101 RepID=A0ABQ9I2C2_9NEOP|nr:hypothetical protein PR048_010035 [Dryococelus australis]
MEEQLEEYLSNLTQNFDETDTENEDESNTREMNNQLISSPMETDESFVTNCLKKKYPALNVLNTFIRHALQHQSGIPLCYLCAKKSATETSRKHCKRGLHEQAEKMLQTSGKKFPPASTSDNILVSIPDVDRGRLAPRNVLARIMEEV